MRLVNKSCIVAVAALVLMSAPATADTDTSDWVAKVFGGAERSKASRGNGTKTAVTSSGSGESGVASYYWQPQQVASGGTFNPNALTAAHKTLPFGTRVRVTSVASGRSVDVVINDRGPFVRGRVIDLSRRAAQNIGMTGAGIANVRLQVL